jgi:hypothetical protein
MKQLNEKYAQHNYCGKCTPHKFVSPDNILFTCILATALQSTSHMQSTDVNYLAHKNICGYACNVVATSNINEN